MPISIECHAAQVKVDAASSASLAELRPDDVVLVKGSRGVGLERVAAALRGPGEIRTGGAGGHT